MSIRNKKSQDEPGSTTSFTSTNPWWGDSRLPLEVENPSPPAHAQLHRGRGLCGPAGDQASYRSMMANDALSLSRSLSLAAAPKQTATQVDCLIMIFNDGWLMDNWCLVGWGSSLMVNDGWRLVDRGQWHLIMVQGNDQSLVNSAQRCLALVYTCLS